MEKVMTYRVSEGKDHKNNKPLFQVIGIDNEYVGEWHTDRGDAKKELKDLEGSSSTYAGEGTVIKKGNRVRVVNTKYDGKEGLVMSNDLQDGNYQVQVDGKVKGFPFENLMLLSREAYAEGGEIGIGEYVSFKKGGKDLNGLITREVDSENWEIHSSKPFSVAMISKSAVNGVAERKARRRFFEDGGSVGQTILQQLGGNRFVAMTGAKKFVQSSKDNWLAFRIGRNKSKANYVKIKLMPNDTYTVTFSRIHGANFTELKEYDTIYFDQLETTFTEYTGLYTRLEDGGYIKDGKSLSENFKLKDEVQNVEFWDNDVIVKDKKGKTIRIDLDKGERIPLNAEGGSVEENYFTGELSFLNW